MRRWSCACPEDHSVCSAPQGRSASTVRFTLKWQSNPLSVQRLCTSAGKLLPFRRASSPTLTHSKVGCPVKNSLGLTWAEIGPVLRLPGYASAQRFLATGIATSVRVVGGEMDFFGPAEQQQPGSGAALWERRTRFGLRVFADPAVSEAGLNFFSSLGVDAIYSTIPLGVRLQPAGVARRLGGGWLPFPRGSRWCGESCMRG